MVSPKQAGKIFLLKTPFIRHFFVNVDFLVIFGVFCTKIFPACLGLTMSFLTKPFEIWKVQMILWGGVVAEFWFDP